MDLKEENHMLRAICTEKGDTSEAFVALLDRYAELEEDLQSLRSEANEVRREKERMAHYINDVPSEHFKGISRDRRVIPYVNSLLYNARQDGRVRRFNWDRGRGEFKVQMKDGQMKTIFIPDEGSLDYGIALKEAIMNLAKITNDSLVRIFLLMKEDNHE